MRFYLALVLVLFVALAPSARADGASTKTKDGAKPLSMVEVTFPRPQLENFDDAFKARLQATNKLKLRLYYFNSWTNQFNPDQGMAAKVKEIRAYVKSLIKGHAA